MMKHTRIWATLAAASVTLTAACSGDGLTNAPAVVMNRAGMPSLTDASSTQAWLSVNPVCDGARGVGKNDNIVGLGYLDGVKLDGGTLVTAVATTIQVPGLGTITYTTNGTTTGLVSWSSTFPIDAVVMKGSRGAIEYQYANGATSGTSSGTGDFATPNTPNGRPAEISHINFCWYGRFGDERTPPPDEIGFFPDVTGSATYTRDYQWAIAKTAAAPASITTGNTVTIDYTVTMTRSTQGESKFGIDGAVTVTNPAGYGTSGTVDGVLVGIPGASVTVSCPSTTFPTTLASGASLTCTYTATGLTDKADRVVTATAQASGLWRPTTATTLVTFGDPTELTDELATVTDDLKELGDDGVVTGDLTFTSRTIEYALTSDPITACGPYTVTNTASFTTETAEETGSDAVTTETRVTGCTLEATVDGAASFARDYDWTIDKTITTAGTETSVATGGTASVGYKVTMTPTLQDGGYTIAGTVTVTNPAASKFGTNATIGAVTVDVGGVAATVTCDDPLTTLAEGASFTCAYTAAVPDDADRDVTATVAEAGDWAESDSPETTVTFSGVEPTVTDGAATVSDTKYEGFPNSGVVQASGGTRTFEYTVDWPAGTACGPYDVTNTASFVASTDDEETDDTGSDAATRTIKVTGCKLALVAAGTPLYTRDYDWSIVKTSNPSLTVAPNTPVTIPYTITVTRTTRQDANIRVEGAVTVTNPSGNGFGAAGMGAVTVNLTGGLPAANQPTSCSAPQTLVQGGSVNCTFIVTTQALPTASIGLSASVAAVAPYWDGNTSSPVTVTFGAPTSEIDATATVTDSRAPDGTSTPTILGTATGTQTFPYSITYAATSFAPCTDVIITNVASLGAMTTQTGALTSTDTKTLKVSGCTDGTELGTAFAYPNNPGRYFPTLSSNAIKRWGWSVPKSAIGKTVNVMPTSSADAQALDVYVGSPFADPTTRGRKVGTVKIWWTGSSWTYAFSPNTAAGYGFSSQHFYAGTSDIPGGRKPTVAPGQYPSLSTYNNSGATAFIFHAVITYRLP